MGGGGRLANPWCTGHRLPWAEGDRFARPRCIYGSDKPYLPPAPESPAGAAGAGPGYEVQPGQLRAAGEAQQDGPSAAAPRLPRPVDAAMAQRVNCTPWVVCVALDSHTEPQHLDPPRGIMCSGPATHAGIQYQIMDTACPTAQASSQGPGMAPWPSARAYRSSA